MFMGKNSFLTQVLLSIVPFVFIYITWILALHFSWLPSWFLPTPEGVFTTISHSFMDGTVAKILLESSLNLIPPYIVAVVASIVFGIVIGTNSLARKIFFPFISTLYPIPSIAWLPFIIILFGFTRESVWILLFLSSFLRMIYNMIVGVRNLNPVWILVAKNFGLTRLQMVIKVIIPGALPNIITGMRLGFGSIWRSVIAAEMLVGGAGGLGKYMANAQLAFDFDKIFLGIILIAIIGLVIESLIFKKLESSAMKKWGLSY